MLMSDTTFHLEESLTGLAKISSLQQQLKSTTLSDTERQDTISLLRQEESSAPYHTQFGLHNVELIRDLTATSKEPFVVGEIVDRLAAVSISEM
jgi:ubiquitin conjugation factor E4 B